MKTDTPPPRCDGCLLSYPAPRVLLVTINREKQMNSLGHVLHWQMHRLFNWFDNEPQLNVAIITGAGKKAFCAGQDLIELGKRGEKSKNEPWLSTHPVSGFAGLSRRVGRKPVIAAVNGFALGGGMEIVLNCDMVVAAPNARFGLPEALRGVYAGAGGLPRLVKNCGMMIASEIAFTGRHLTAQEAQRFNLVNKIAKSQESVVEEALEYASLIAKCSPDSVIITKAGLREAWETASVERAYQLVDEKMKTKLYESENTKEGLAAFAEKRSPNWVPSKL